MQASTWTRLNKIWSK